MDRSSKHSRKGQFPPPHNIILLLLSCDLCHLQKLDTSRPGHWHMRLGLLLLSWVPLKSLWIWINARGNSQLFDVKKQSDKVVLGRSKQLFIRVKAFRTTYFSKINIDIDFHQGLERKLHRLFLLLESLTMIIDFSHWLNSRGQNKKLEMETKDHRILHQKGPIHISHCSLPLPKRQRSTIRLRDKQVINIHLSLSLSFSKGSPGPPSSIFPSISSSSSASSHWPGDPLIDTRFLCPIAEAASFI